MFGKHYANVLFFIPIDVPADGNCMVHALHVSNRFNGSTVNAWIYQMVYEYAVHMDNVYIIEILYNKLSE